MSGKFRMPSGRVVTRVKMQAKYSGKCHRCSGGIGPGDWILYCPEMKKTVHIGCERLPLVTPEGKIDRDQIYGMPLADLVRPLD